MKTKIKQLEQKIDKDRMEGKYPYKDFEKLQEMKQKNIKTSKIKKNGQNSSNGHIALPKSIAKANEQPLAKGESIGSNPISDAIFLEKIPKIIILKQREDVIAKFFRVDGSWENLTKKVKLDGHWGRFIVFENLQEAIDDLVIDGQVVEIGDEIIFNETLKCDVCGKEHPRMNMSVECAKCYIGGWEIENKKKQKVLDLISKELGENYCREQMGKSEITAMNLSERIINTKDADSLANNSHTPDNSSLIKEALALKDEEFNKKVENLKEIVEERFGEIDFLRGWELNKEIDKIFSGVEGK